MKPETILAITSFPPKGRIHADYAVGVASYAKNTLRAIQHATQSKGKLSLAVIAERLDGGQDYTEGKIKVKRVWERSSFTAFPRMLNEIFKNYKNTKTILFEFELSMFGGFIYLLPLPIFLLALKLLNKKIIFVCHQVVSDMGEIAPHINLDQKSFKTGILNGLLKLFYSFILLITSRVIVFEEDLKDRLSQFGNSRKIVVIPHGVQEFRRIPNKEDSRKKLGIGRNAFVILSFGFLAWYKGTDWLIHAINHVKKNKKLKSENIQLVLAGGPNPNHEDKEYYRRYIKNIMNECQRNGIILTGFVEERDIPAYFKACDLVVLPYRTFMSSSGPLSIAFSFKKPFLLSPPLRGILESEDIQSVLSDLRLREEDLLFHDFFGQDFEKKLIKLTRSATLRRRLTRFSSEAKKARSWEVIGKKYYEELIN